MDVALVVQSYQDIRKKLGSSVFDGRCLIFGVSTELMAQNQTDILQFGSVDGWKTSWQDIEDLVTQVYYILESKRVEKSKLNQSQLEKMPLMAPFERKSTSVIDIESRSFRKKQQGRLKKHIGDLCLLAGLPQEALTAYNSALENLRVRQGFFDKDYSENLFLFIFDKVKATVLDQNFKYQITITRFSTVFI